MPGPLRWSVYEVVVAAASDKDMDELRHVVDEVIADWNREVGRADRTVLIAQHWHEQAGSVGRDAQAETDRRIVDTADMLIGAISETLGQGTIHEIRRFADHGKGDRALVYRSTVSPHQAKEIQAKLGFPCLICPFDGINGRFRTTLAGHLSDKVKVLNKPTRSGARLRRVIDQILDKLPRPIASFILEHSLAEVARVHRAIADELASVPICHGLIEYQPTIHARITLEKSSTRLIAICGEKGLDQYEDADRYFRKFYEHAAKSTSRTTSVYRLFVESARGKPHSDTIRRVIADHRARSPGVRALELKQERRNQLDPLLKGVCASLDEGFGMIIFERFRAQPLVMIHAGRGEDLVCAECKTPESMQVMRELAHCLFIESEEYLADKEGIKSEVDDVFNQLAKQRGSRS